MRLQDLESLIDPDKEIDRLEHISDVMEYYKLNHVTPEKKRLLHKSLLFVFREWIEKIGIKIEEM